MSDDQPTNDAPTNDGQQFDRLPETADEREVEGRATRREVVEWWDERFAIPPETFEGYSFWEKGKGKIWILRGEIASPIRVEALGMKFLRTRQEHWKPTTNAVQRFGRRARRNVVELTREQAQRFVRGETQELDWDGDWGYLVATHELAGEQGPLGVGLYVHGELQSPVPKGRQREL
jgi:NOL1/NOP2/fmu family ribosome biogenesis protein